MTVDFTKERLFKACSYCGLTRLMSFHGRRWLCDDCAAEVGLIDSPLPSREQGAALQGQTETPENSDQPKET